MKRSILILIWMGCMGLVCAMVWLVSHGAPIEPSPTGPAPTGPRANEKGETRKRVVDGLIVEALPGVGEEARAAAFTTGFVLWERGTSSLQRVWVVEGDRVTAAWANVLMKNETRKPWRGESGVIDAEKQKKIRECLERLSDKLGYSYENPNIRDGEYLTLYGTPDAKGLVVLVSKNADIKALYELFGMMPALGMEREKMPVVEDGRMVEVLDRAIKRAP